ncbi:hypothetical protein LJC63_00465 [Ruminococcaceae bacterium OttesenSCG-928-L11]|nr:hypothetical protein [Ruminococcaceae bacterium OttesenSCG-928-L11]
MMDARCGTDTTTHTWGESGANVSLRTPQVLRIEGEGQSYFGANQAWYRDSWKRQAGCGPTTSAHILWYLSRTRAGWESLCPYDGNRQAGFLSLMNEVWEYVTPTAMGVNKTGMLLEGVIRYAASKSIPLTGTTVEVPPLGMAKSRTEDATNRIARALSADIPVAFLNLSNGSLQNLDSWHWVTIVAFAPQTNLALIYDQGQCKEIDLALWMKTTTLGGGFVLLD